MYQSLPQVSLAPGSSAMMKTKALDERGRLLLRCLQVNQPRDRVDFLAAGMWASFISATGAESQVSLPRAEELGEALVQGYLQPMKIDDERALAVAASLDKGKDGGLPEYHFMT